MQLKTILNRVHKQPGFVYGKAEFVEVDKGAQVLEVHLEPDERTQPVCSGCGKKGPGYDRLSLRRFEFVPLWGIAVFFLYALRRVACGNCGVKVEKVPWAEGKSPMTKAYMWFLAAWAKRMSWQEVAEVFRCSWDKVFLSVERAVEWGLAHRDLSGITSLGVDEVAWKVGHKFLTVVYQLVPRQRRDVQRACRGAEQPAQSSNQKGLRVSDLPRDRGCPLSYPRKAPGSPGLGHPQILLRSLKI